MAMGKKILKFILGGLISGAFCLAQEAPQDGKPETTDAYRISRRQQGLVISVGEKEILNLYQNTRGRLGAHLAAQARPL